MTIESINTVTLDKVIAVLVAIASLYFGYFQWRAKNRIERLQSRFDLMKQFYSSTTLHQTFQAIDYGKSFLGKDFAGSEAERHLDQLLLFLDHVEKSFNERTISKEGHDAFEYFFNRIKHHHEILSYLKFHRKIICETTGTKVSPFESLLVKFESEIEAAPAVDIFSGKQLSA